MAPRPQTARPASPRRRAGRLGVAAPSPSRFGGPPRAEPGAGATGSARIVAAGGACGPGNLNAAREAAPPRVGRGVAAMARLRAAKTGAACPSRSLKNQSGGRGPPAPHHAHRSAAPLRVALPIVQPGPASRVKPGSQGLPLTPAAEHRQAPLARGSNHTQRGLAHVHTSQQPARPAPDGAGAGCHAPETRPRAGAPCAAAPLSAGTHRAGVLRRFPVPPTFRRVSSSARA